MNAQCVLPYEPADGMVGGMITELKRVGVAPTVDHMSVRSEQEPAEVPATRFVSHRNRRFDTSNGMGTANEKLLILVEVARPDLHKDFIRQHTTI